MICAVEDSFLDVRRQQYYKIAVEGNAVGGRLMERILIRLPDEATLERVFWRPQY